MTAPVTVLGLDVSPLRLGWGLVSLDDGTAIACGMERIDLPHKGWMETQITEALKSLPPCHVAAVYIEQPALPPVSGTKSAYNAGRAIQAAHTVVRKRWPEAPVEYLMPSEWKKLAGLPGNAKKASVLDAVDALTRDNVAAWSPEQDAADALLIALAGQRRNEENWQKALDRGAA